MNIKHDFHHLKGSSVSSITPLADTLGSIERILRSPSIDEETKLKFVQLASRITEIVKLNQLLNEQSLQLVKQVADEVNQLKLTVSPVSI